MSVLTNMFGDCEYESPDDQEGVPSKDETVGEDIKTGDLRSNGCAICRTIPLEDEQFIGPDAPPIEYFIPLKGEPMIPTGMTGGPPNFEACSLWDLVATLSHVWLKKSPPKVYHNWAGVTTCSPMMDVRLDPNSIVIKRARIDNIDAAPVHANPLNAPTLTRIRQWIKVCGREHTECGGGIVPLLPARVLDLGNSPAENSVRLVETAGQRDQYVALSHCWGMSQPFVMTTSNLEERMENIAIDKVPKTYRDAIAVIRTTATEIR